MTETKEKKVTEINEVDQLVAKAKKSLVELMKLDQEKINKIVHAMVMAGVDKHMELAKAAVEETKRGIYEDKCIKNLYSTETIWHSIKYQKTCGVIDRDMQTGVIKVASPLGVVAGITPVTNPTSTTLFKSIISIMARNPIIFAFHPNAQNCSSMAAKTVYDAAVKAGAPKDCIQWVTKPSMEATTQLINHPNVAITLATGGNAMVKSAYSTGKPALGVGAGNVPAYFEKSADIRRSVNDIIVSKTFDNGMICASEQAVIVDKEIYDEVKKEFERNRAYIVPKKDIKKLEKYVINEERQMANPDIVGQSAMHIAEMAGISVPEGTKLLIAEVEGVGPNYPLTREKLSPVLAMLKAESTEDGFAKSRQMLEFNGMGHSASIHTFGGNNELIESFAEQMEACRILVNSPSSIGGIGDLYNEMRPSLTLGCGSYGKNSVSENVSVHHLINVKTIAKRRNNMQWQKLPSKLYFEKNSIRYLEKMPDVERVVIITDPGMVKFGLVARVVDVLRRRSNDVKYEIFSDVEPDPTTNTVQRGLDKIKAFEPDTIIAIGGGSPMDAAKMMWLQYEHPEVDFFGAKQKFLDIRKRAYKLPDLGEKCQLVCIPTTSGTGSEVTPFAVITDAETHVKYPIADYSLTPSVAIVDPQFTYTLPKSMVAYTGMDVLTHAFESYVSAMASDYTRGLSLQAVELVFSSLKDSYYTDAHEPKETMHNASTIAGMAFANAFLGINHSLAHKIGAEFNIPHGYANAILMPHVIRYNAKNNGKTQVWAKYEYFRADEDYARIAKLAGCEGNTTEELVEALVQKVITLGKDLNLKLSIKDQGVSKEEFEAKVDKLAELAYLDQCTTANPKEPMIEELKEILYQAYEGC
ncbi:bifunctional acetaldehyde-CoA/alcohol dehydrogenase [Helcococcus kunzii]|uniref:bifunctional acetaldehyde-CoA/alcohol dehydrogenase n=1 Tax=Helcococcus kunzii TaxID=40091 RepID=UPI001BB0423C|nr:bifunctional acetaldehyde-CoA/alcohol dehydrogenase [Helcococcus kunzii]MCT1795869.1 bifunctional acetaldehyde-CoA/alcohol dehydrogenase [Helcococcus kunzii]MCT1988579.1 bifunctional acetaldehyde-CoA/alcohol dehydrogenase [Helcococcus kunzii]QUY65156.1 bifunctional acetaldehyde-CoA/alcohol dehydrogenase [Helcococcus kunzii]QZO75817.1 bifunctional acetaldehyde-CoA/alcohol dehydrogenase [Helcococcus kunzii]